MRHSKFYLSFALLIVLFSITGCGTGTYENASEMVTDVKSRINTVSIEEFASVMDKGVDFKIIDCREPKEFKGGYING